MKSMIFVIVTCLSILGGFATARVLDKPRIIRRSKNE